MLQGDTLAPFLFIIVLDYVLRLSLDTINDKGLQIHPRRRRRQPATHITDLDFADDIALVSDLATNAEALLHSVEDAASLVGLHCNETKTEVISSTPNSSFRSLAGNSIKQVEDFKYLGSFVMNSEKDMKSRKALAWVACNKLNKIWHSTLANETKVYIFKTLIEPILLYGAETWTLTTRQQKRLDGAYTNMLRRVQNIHWSEACHPRAHIWRYPASVTKGHQAEVIVRRTLPPSLRGNDTSCIIVEASWPCPLQRPHIPRYHREGCVHGKRRPPCGNGGPRGVAAGCGFDPGSQGRQMMNP